MKTNQIVQVNRTRQNGTPESFQGFVTGIETITTTNVKGQVIPLVTYYRVRRIDSGRTVNVNRQYIKVIA